MSADKYSDMIEQIDIENEIRCAENINWSNSSSFEELPYTPVPATEKAVPAVSADTSTTDPNTLDCCPVYPSSMLPTRGTPDSAGLDLYSTLDVIVPPGRRVRIPTGIEMAIPKNAYGYIADKSSMAWNRGFHVFGGIIDSDYRGEISVILFNSSTRTQFINKDDPIAQLIIQPYINLTPRSVNQLSETERGNNGFGSTSCYGSN